MGFKLFIDSTQHYPHLVCDVCGEKINDIWNSKATSTPGSVGQTGDVSVHHPSCVMAGAVTISLIDFLRLFTIKNSVGDLSEVNGVTRALVEYPTDKGFEP